MGRKKKSILNQIVNKPKEEISVEIPEEIDENLEENHGIDAVEDVENIIQEEVSLKDSGERLVGMLQNVENLNNDDDVVTDEVVEEIIIRKPTKEQLSKLSKSGLRWYLRTGKLPK